MVAIKNINIMNKHKFFISVFAIIGLVTIEKHSFGQRLQDAIAANMNKESVAFKITSIVNNIYKTTEDTTVYDIFQKSSKIIVDGRNQQQVNVIQNNGNLVTTYFAGDSFEHLANIKSRETQKLEVDNSEGAKCYQLRSINLHPGENPYLSCFYSEKKLIQMAKLRKKDGSYYYKMRNTWGEFEKEIWFNLKTLFVDSIHYELGNASVTKVFSYYDPKNFDMKKADSLYSINERKIGNQIKVELVDSVQMNWLKSYGNSSLYLLDFWYIGCAPCLASFPDIQKIANQFDSTQLTIIALNPKDKQSDITNYKVIKNYTFPMVLDIHELNIFLNIRVFPTKILVNREGKIIQTYYGTNKDEFVELNNLIAQYNSD